MSGRMTMISSSRRHFMCYQESGPLFVSNVPNKQRSMYSCIDETCPSDVRCNHGVARLHYVCFFSFGVEILKVYWVCLRSLLHFV